jgi:hypothetical protein
VAAYLLDEVIDRLVPELLDFLVRVSILDVVTPDLADALTDSRSGAATLADLAASNLFVHAVGPAGQWYRLHRLLADLLRSRITAPRTLRDLHRRAAEWYLHQAKPLEAVRYALRGGLWPLAAQILGRHLLALVIRGNPRTVDMLLSAIPRDALLSHPELAAALAGARIHAGSPTELAELIAAARAGADRLPAQRAQRLRVVVLHLIEIGHSRAQGDLAGVAAACRQIPGIQPCSPRSALPPGTWCRSSSWETPERANSGPAISPRRRTTCAPPQTSTPPARCCGLTSTPRPTWRCSITSEATSTPHRTRRVQWSNTQSMQDGPCRPRS